MNFAFRKLLLPILVFLGFLSFFVFGDQAVREFSSRALGRTYEYLPYVVGVGAWLSAAFLVNRLINVFIWETLIPRATGAQTPRLLIQLSGVVIFFLAGVGIVGVVFEQSVTGILAASGALGLVIGFALRSIILDLFTGLALNVERPFRIGDYVNILTRGIPGCSGRVEEINWRSTLLMTSEGSIQIVPNSIVGTAVITNYSRPVPTSEFELVVVLDFNVESARVLRILDAALKEAVLVDGPLADPAPRARISRIDQTGVHYKMKYHIDPRRGGPGKMRHLVLDHVLHHLRKAGLTPAYPKQDTFTGQMPERQLDYRDHAPELLGRLDLFRDLTEEECNDLAKAMFLRHFAADEVIIRRGEPGGSMFILVEGILDVLAPAPDAAGEVRVGRIRPGEFFGEMSLLTGAPRSATVVAVTATVTFEIGKKDMARILDARPEVAEEISRVVAERQVALGGARAGRQAPKEAEVVSLAARVLDGIKRFFGMGLKTA